MTTGRGNEPATAAEAWRLITAVMMARKEQFPQIAASFKLNPGALHALLTLDPDEPRSMSALAGGWGCDASNVTWLVDRQRYKEAWELVNEHPEAVVSTAMPSARSTTSPIRRVRPDCTR